jgi:hypothetical protein
VRAPADRFDWSVRAVSSEVTMSIFAKQHTSTIPLPFDEPNTVTIRRLSGRQLERAGEASLSTTVRRTQAIGRFQALQAAVLEVARSGSATDAAMMAALEKVNGDPMQWYDRDTLIREGIVSWTYGEPVGPDTLSDLVPEAFELLSLEILKFAKPDLFLTPDEREEARKND